MESIIYVNNNNNVETYLVNIDIEKIKSINTSIDDWTDKGELIVETGQYLEPSFSIKREIISQKQIGFTKDKWVIHRNNHPVYEFKYYEYPPHPLSLLCENFFKIENKKLPLECSSYLRKIIDYIPTNYDEEKYLSDIISCFQLTKIDTEELAKSDIDLTKKISLLNKIKFLLTNKELPKSEFLPKSYIDLIESRLNEREIIVSNSNFCSIRYTEEQRNNRKIRALNSLPKNEDLKKYKLIK